MDPLTTKPKVYEYIRNVTGGTPTLFTLNGPKWHAKRKAVAPAFTSIHIKRMNRVALEKTDMWIKNTLSGTDKSFDVGKEMNHIVLSALSETAFEYEMSPEEQHFFTSELDLAMVEFIRKSPNIPFRYRFARFIPECRRAMVASQNLLGLTKLIMNEYRKKNSFTDGTIIQLIMKSNAFPSDDEKAAQLLEFLFAGHDTTGNR
jgi:cytochrome P450